MRRRLSRLSLVLLAPACLAPGPGYAAAPSLLTLQPPSSAVVSGYARAPETGPQPTPAAMLALLRKRVKYVFVLFQENRSFDNHFGTFPGADGLFTRPPSQTPGFRQPLVDTDGSVQTITPFLITPSLQDPSGAPVPLYPADTDSTDHSHEGINNSLDLDPATMQARNDRYALDEEGLTTQSGRIVSLATGLPAAKPPSQKQKQRGELVMAHLDCDTTPFLWQFADHFVLFDNFYQTIIGPSSPNALAMIAGQAGETQWALHPYLAGVPMLDDPAPYAGSLRDAANAKPPFGTRGTSAASPGPNQTYATLPLSFMGRDIAQTIKADQNPQFDLLDVQDDIRTIAGDGIKPTGWGWYQEGYDHEPTDRNAAASHATYIAHHNGPQYFGYIGDNTRLSANLHGLDDFYRDVAARRLPKDGGVFYVRGGYGNNDGLVPVDPTPAVRSAFAGSDDHPGYSDTQIAESLVADEVNAIAASPYWNDSAIFIVYDETDGLYDHRSPHIRERDRDGNPLAAGPRIPAIVISPFARAHVVSHEYAEHSSVIKFVDALFGLTPLAMLPDERKGRAAGLREFGQPDLGPADGPDSEAGSLYSAFDPARLQGRLPPLPASYAMVPEQDIRHLPHLDGQGCHALGITPTDYVQGKLIDPPPADFNPRPGTSPGIPSYGNWTP